MSASVIPQFLRDQSTAFLGVLGGMGPAATADFLAKLVQSTPVSMDQDHIPTVTCSIPQIPSRTDAILCGGPSPLPAMLKTLRVLETCGASYVAIPCNTAHYWFNELQCRTSLPIVHVVDAAAHMILELDTTVRTVGLLATTGTTRAGIYSNRLSRFGIECLAPGEQDQHLVMNVIQSIKAGQLDQHGKRIIRRVADRMRSSGAQFIILGCSELPLMFPNASQVYVDSTKALAQACVRAFFSTRLRPAAELRSESD